MTGIRSLVNHGALLDLPAEPVVLALQVGVLGVQCANMVLVLGDLIISKEGRDGEHETSNETSMDDHQLTGQ